MGVGRRGRGRWWGRIVAALSLAVAGSLLGVAVRVGVPGLVAGASAAPIDTRLPSAVVDPSAVVQLAGPGVALTAPVDGRLRGDGVALIVVGAALTDRAGSGDEVVSAGSGHHLVVFALRRVPLPEVADPPPSSLSLVAAGDRRLIDLSRLSGSGPGYFAAPVPSGATEVDLELSASGFSQRFSLMTLARPGPDPAVLYRDGDGPAVIDQDNSAVGVAVTTGPPDSASYRLMVGVVTTTVGWFAPDAARRTPPSPDRAFLAAMFKVTGDPGQPASKYVEYPSAVPAADVHLVLGDGTRVEGAHVSDPVDLHLQGIDTMFAGVYYFAVPADISQATVAVDGYSARGLAGGFFASPATINLSPFTIPLALSAPPAPTPATTATTRLKLARPASGPASAAEAASHRGDTGLNAVLPLVAVVVVGAGAAALAAVGAVNMSRPRPRPRRCRGNRLPAVPAPRRAPMATAAAPLSHCDPPRDNRIGRHGRRRSPKRRSRGRRPTGVGLGIGTVGDAYAHPRPARSGTARRAVFRDPGPVAGHGLDQRAAPSVPVVDLATYLALHPQRPYTAEELRDPLSLGKARALEADTIRTYASTLRRAVGADHLPDAGRAGYALAGFGSDWARFQEIVGGVAPEDEPALEAAKLAEALSLIRGAPFSDLPASGFVWVATELMISQVEVAVIAAARRLVALALAAGDWPLAAWAAERALAVVPTAQDLNANALQAAQLSCQADRIAQTWRDVTRRYSAADEPVPAELHELHVHARRPSMTEN
jgi:hypothetical protein